MNWTISKDHHFSASHQLGGLPEDHPCSRLHGHNFVVRVVLEAEELDGVGFVVDYNDLRPFTQWLDDEYDHRHLNDKVGFNPTSENMAAHIYRVARASFGLPVAEVAWSETPKTWAVYRP